MSSIKKVICAMSGGVDSAVSAFLLKNKGFHVEALFMKNWDTRDELGYCTSEDDRMDAQYVCHHLSIPLHHVNFEKEYWNDVFSYLLKEYKSGATPNPDVLCNKHIKFDAFLRHAREKHNADVIATGHYAQIGHSTSSSGVKLLQANDPIKDQTLFLAQISQHALRSSIFPVGHMKKRDVKKIASEAGLERLVRKKESMGICFIGKKDFKKFLDQYIDPRPGLFIDIETDRAIGEHRGVHHYTVGQRSGISSLGSGYYVVRKDPHTQNISVALGTNHPALYSDTFYTDEPHWIHEPPRGLAACNGFACDFRFQHIHPLIRCNAEIVDRGLSVKLERPLRALTPGQFAVFYEGRECLGSARMRAVGQSYETKGRNEIIESTVEMR